MKGVERIWESIIKDISNIGIIASTMNKMFTIRIKSFWTLQINLRDYLTLVRWSADRTPNTTPPVKSVLNKYSMDAHAWFDQYQNHQTHWQRAVGSVDRLRAYAEKLGLKWIRKRKRLDIVSVA